MKAVLLVYKAQFLQFEKRNEFYKLLTNIIQYRIYLYEVSLKWMQVFLERGFICITPTNVEEIFWN